MAKGLCSALESDQKLVGRSCSTIVAWPSHSHPRSIPSDPSQACIARWLAAGIRSLTLAGAD